MPTLRVLVVEDSVTVRRHLVDVLRREPDIEVVGEAEDGQQAIQRCVEQRPDLITMDIMLPGLSGVAAIEYIMAHCPTPILVVSAASNRGEVYETYDAISAGAVDVIEKPLGTEAPGTWERAFVQALRIVARVRVITHPRARLSGMTPALAQRGSSKPPRTSSKPELVAIGASTGGPKALVTVLGALPRDYRLPILAVMHIGSAFAAPFCDWLGSQISLPVSYARGGEVVPALRGQVTLAPADRHLVVDGKRLVLNDESERHSCKPSVDVLFESVARAYGASAAGCLLTGMGRDGALGLLAMKRAGATTIAQDEATSVIYGMPREAALLGAADEILPLGDIGAALAAFARRT